MDPDALAQAIADILSGLIGQAINNALPPAIANALFGAPIFDYRPALTQIYNTLVTVENRQADQYQQLFSQISLLRDQVSALAQQPFSVTIPQPVQATVPATPTWYTAPPTGGSVASDVWGTVLISGTTADDTLSQARGHVRAWAGVLALRYPGQPYLLMVGHDLWQDNIPETVTPHAALDPSTILPTDASPIAWVTRQYSTYGWGTFTLNGQPYFAYADPSASGIYWALDLTQFQFLQLQAATIAPTGAPVWPGLASVTLGSSVALVDQLVVTGPMDGVIVTISSVPTTKTSYMFATTENDWFRIGAMSFRDDNGQYEPPQLLGFADAIYCPRQMHQASAAVFRLQGAITGTVQPWTIT